MTLVCLFPKISPGNDYEQQLAASRMTARYELIWALKCPTPAHRATGSSGCSRTLSARWPRLTFSGWTSGASRTAIIDYLIMAIGSESRWQRSFGVALLRTPVIGGGFRWPVATEPTRKASGSIRPKCFGVGNVSILSSTNLLHT